MKNLNGRMLRLVAAGLLIAASANAKTKGNQGNPSPSPSPTPAHSKKHESAKANGNTVDLRGTISQMKLKDGANVVHSGDGAKLIADVKGGKVTGWKVTDDKGKSLPSHTTTSAIEGECEVCYPCKNKPGCEICYTVPCSVVVKVPPSKISAH